MIKNCKRGYNIFYNANSTYYQRATVIRQIKISSDSFCAWKCENYNGT